jgi:hypothetical protein
MLADKAEDLWKFGNLGMWKFGDVEMWEFENLKIKSTTTSLFSPLRHKDSKFHKVYSAD